MKLGLFGYSMMHIPLPMMLREAARIGYEAVEIMATKNANGYPGILDNEQRKWVKSFCDDNNIEITALGTHQPFIHREKSRRKELMDFFKMACDMGNEWGIKYLTTASGPVPEDIDREEGWKIIEETVRSLLELAGKYNIKVAWEIHAHKNELTYAPADLKRLLDTIDSPGLGVNCDASHYVMVGCDPIESTEMFKGKIFHTHLKGMKGKDFTYPNPESDFPTERWLDTLRAVGFDGTISVEVSPNLDCLWKIEKAFKYLRPIVR